MRSTPSTSVSCSSVGRRNRRAVIRPTKGPLSPGPSPASRRGEKLLLRLPTAQGRGEELPKGEGRSWGGGAFGRWQLLEEDLVAAHQVQVLTRALLDGLATLFAAAE